MSNPNYRKKLIEVALPLEAINRESAREKSIRHGHPSTLHLWWARRPLAACRAVLFAQLVDDPSAHPDKFPTEEDQKSERERLFKIIEELVKWKNINNEKVLEVARQEILKSTDGNPPPVFDPFCGGGSIPLEAQRLGLKAYASDLNPVAVLVTKALIEIPPKFSGRPPVHPGAQKSSHWYGTKGLAEDVRYYGKQMLYEAEKLIGHFYPKATLPKEYGGGEATVISWLWTRTVKCPNPACGAQMPLLGSFSLCSKKGKSAWIEPVIEKNQYHFQIKTGSGKPRKGTMDRRGGTCLCCNTPVPFEYLRSEGKADRMGMRLLAVVVDGHKGKVYLPPIQEHEELLEKTGANNAPDTHIPEQALGFRVQLYGIKRHQDLFNSRQLLALSTFCDLVPKIIETVLNHSDGDEEYAKAIATYLTFAIGRYADYGSSMTYWDDRGPSIQKTFSLPTLQMRWSFPETNPFASLFRKLVTHG